jgi:hypothetical protein
MAILKPLKSGYFIWKYLPSAPAAAIFAVLFFAITIAHGWRIHKTQLWFCIPILLGGFSKTCGAQILILLAHFVLSGIYRLCRSDRML